MEGRSALSAWFDAQNITLSPNTSQVARLVRDALVDDVTDNLGICSSLMICSKR